jgi:hypothetical protein
VRSAILAMIILLNAIAVSSQDAPSLQGNLHFVERTVEIMTCKAAGGDPEDYYDCQLMPGHTINEIVRIMMREMREQNTRCEADRKMILRTWKHYNDEMLKTLPKPVPHDKNGKS